MSPLPRALRYFQGAVLSSDLADGIYKIAIPLLALGVDRSVLAITAVGLAVRLPWLVAMLPAGVLADRVEPGPLMRAGAVVRLGLVALLGVLAVTTGLDLVVLVVAGFLVGCAGTVIDVSAQSRIPRLVTSAQLPRANASLQTIQVTMAQLAGPAVGGWLAGLGAGLALWTVAVLYAATVVLLGAIPDGRPPTGAATRTPATIRSLTRELGDGVRYLVRRADLRRLSVTAAVNNFSYAMCLTVLPLWAVGDGLGLTGGGLGALLACLAVGSIVAGLGGGRLLPAVGEVRLALVGPPLLGVCFAALAVPHVAVAAVALVAYGVVSMLWNVVVTTHRQRTIPPEVFGRVNSAYRWVSWGVIPLGALVGGAVAALDLGAVFVVAGALPFLVGVLFPLRLDHLAALSRSQREAPQ